MNDPVRPKPEAKQFTIKEREGFHLGGWGSFDSRAPEKRLPADGRRWVKG